MSASSSARNPSWVNAGADCCDLVHEQDWLSAPVDSELFTPQLRAWIPSRIFDAHAHVWCLEHFDEGFAARTPMFKSAPTERATFEDYKALVADTFHACRPTSALFFPYPNASVDVAAANAWAAKQAAADPTGLSRAQMLVTPSMSAQDVRDAVAEHHFVGMKPYHCFSKSVPTFHSEISSFLPDHMCVQPSPHINITINVALTLAPKPGQLRGGLRAQDDRHPPHGQGHRPLRRYQPGDHPAHM